LILVLYSYLAFRLGVLKAGDGDKAFVHWNQQPKAEKKRKALQQQSLKSKSPTQTQLTQ
jgi:hypothetical protein